jgi:hypothetical protein
LEFQILADAFWFRTVRLLPKGSLRCFVAPDNSTRFLVRIV